MPAKKMTANDVISKRLRSIRANNDITQAKIAKRLSMTQTAVSRWERQFGTMNAEQIVAYCEIRVKLFLQISQKGIDINRYM